MTNAEYIRKMNDEELAKFLDGWEVGDVDTGIMFCDVCDGNEEGRCWECTEQWLGENADIGNYLSVFKGRERHNVKPPVSGEWVYISRTSGNDEEFIICSACGWLEECEPGQRPSRCPKCGVKMKSTENEER